MTDWTPWHLRPRPTASSITDEDLDALLLRLERAEQVLEVLAARPPWKAGDDDGREILYQRMREFLHNRHKRRLTPFIGFEDRGARACRMCSLWADRFAERWSNLKPGSDERIEKHLKEISELIDRTHPTMAYPVNATGVQARRELPFLMSLVRQLQRQVRRWEGAASHFSKEADRLRASQSHWEREAKRLQEALAEGWKAGLGVEKSEI